MIQSISRIGLVFALFLATPLWAQDRTYSLSGPSHTGVLKLSGDPERPTVQLSLTAGRTGKTLYWTAQGEAQRGGAIVRAEKPGHQGIEHALSLAPFDPSSSEVGVLFRGERVRVSFRDGIRSTLLYGKPLTAAPAGGAKVLVIVSSANELPLAKLNPSHPNYKRDGSGTAVHPTGYFLGELSFPLAALRNAGYAVEFATPGGIKPTIDRDSLRLAYWLGAGENGRGLPDPNAFRHVEGLAASLDNGVAAVAEYCAPSGWAYEYALTEAGKLLPETTVLGEAVRARRDALRLVSQDYGLELNAPRALESIRDEELAEYAGVLVPGGHAPMVDLYPSKRFGEILRAFHEAGKPTALICHGAVTLRAASTPWPYAGYRMTCISNGEEAFGELKYLRGKLDFLPENLLRKAGGMVETYDLWGRTVVHVPEVLRLYRYSKVVVDRELITAQNPFPAARFGRELVAALGRYAEQGSLNAGASSTAQ